MRARQLILVALVVGLLLGAAGSASAGVLGRCTSVPTDPALCGRVSVPLDRAGAVPGAVSLRVEALPPSGGGAPQATILALAGGPGQAATPLLGSFADVLKPLLRTRELLTFDQRGTGGSGLLSCAGADGANTLAGEVQACASALGPARVGYTTAESVADVEAVRAALGVDKLTVYGTSYGTKVALEYAAAYPQHVDRLILDSVVPPDGIDPFQRSTLTSVPRVLRGVCDGDCRFTRDPGADVARLARRLRQAHLRGAVVDAHGHAIPASMSESDLLGLLLAGDFDRYLRASLPAAVRGALNGDPAPLLRLLANGGGSDSTTASADSDAVYLATTCEDGLVPWPAGTPLQQRRAAEDATAAAIPNSTFAPFDRTSALALGLADLCRGWPEAPIAQPQPPLPPTPTLILSGDQDLRTPRADALALAARLPGAHVVEVPDAGHGALFSDPTDCAEQAVVAFVGGLVPGDCRFHPPVAAALGVAPRRIADVRAAGHVRGLPGRTVTAVLRTLDDASEQLIEQVAGGGQAQPYGGLRAGTAVPESGRGLRLHAYSYVPGVTVTGLVPSRSSRFTLTVGGRSAARGRLLVSRAGVAGVLGGVTVKISAKALGWRAGASAALAPAPAPPAVPLALRPR